MLTWSNLHLLGISRQTLDTPMSKLDKARSVTMEIQWRDVNNSWELFVLYNFLGFQKYIDFISYFDTTNISDFFWTLDSDVNSLKYFFSMPLSFKNTKESFLEYQNLIPTIWYKGDRCHMDRSH